MSVKPILGLLLVAVMGVAMPTPAAADHWRDERGYGRDDDWEDEFRDGPCRVKRESDDGEYKEEIKCPNGRGAWWPRGRWKDEYWDGDCKVKIEAKRDEYKKEVKCDDDD
ncbi:hypothetical protein D3880_05450 [Pseudomonas cavernae]|uniref:Uncharacterized protein n=1 Tax=Pseudomonas cavernae TaxID=2320867 RepID=A0A385YY59_9PSED|nr:hypothetical protein [Pseudomonas cavernae]AYC31859.1 hypothetical protein D3880_05450 [Pseudomonas cavernae]